MLRFRHRFVVPGTKHVPSTFGIKDIYHSRHNRLHSKIALQQTEICAGVLFAGEGERDQFKLSFLQNLLHRTERFQATV